MGRKRGGRATLEKPPPVSCPGPGTGGGGEDRGGCVLGVREDAPCC